MQSLRRVLQTFRSPSDSVEVRLPWGHIITVNPREDIGRLIRKQGLYDLVLTETLWRLAGRGERILDIGANIGYTASLLGARCGIYGEVFCFEPHPEIFHELKSNIDAFMDSGDCAPIRIFPFAASNHEGMGDLVTSEYFSVNRGTAKLGLTAPPEENVVESHSVIVRRLDTFLAGDQPVHMMKIDVEGHEFPAFEGLGEWLSGGKIRDVIFEEHRRYPAPTHLYLEHCGYTLYSLEETFRGPVLKPPTEPTARRFYDTPSYLATVDPERARRLFSSRGWESFRAS